MIRFTDQPEALVMWWKAMKPGLARIFHPFLLRRPKSFRGCVMFRPAILNVYKTRLRSQASHALPRKDLKHLATKRMKYSG